MLREYALLICCQVRIKAALSGSTLYGVAEIGASVAQTDPRTMAWKTQSLTLPLIRSDWIKRRYGAVSTAASHSPTIGSSEIEIMSSQFS